MRQNALGMFILCSVYCAVCRPNAVVTGASTGIQVSDLSFGELLSNRHEMKI